jgi:hypothetical protein
VTLNFLSGCPQMRCFRCHTLNPLAADPDPLSPQILEYARAAVRAVALFMKGLDPDQELFFLLAATTLWTTEHTW